VIKRLIFSPNFLIIFVSVVVRTSSCNPTAMNKLDDLKIFKLDDLKIFKLDDLKIFKLDDLKIFKLDDFKIFKLYISKAYSHGFQQNNDEIPPFIPRPIITVHPYENKVATRLTKNHRKFAEKYVFFFQIFPK